MTLAHEPPPLPGARLPAPHEPLTAGEITAAAALARRALLAGPEPRFVSIALDEPDKDALAAGAEQRRALVIVQRRADHAVVELIVDLESRHVVDERAVPGVHPPVARSALDLVSDVVRAHSGWQEAVRARGIDDLDATEIHPWPPGFHDPVHGGRRIARCLTYLRLGPDDNVFAHPFEDLVVTVDLDTGEVLALEDAGVVPVPRAQALYALPKTQQRTDVRPIEITQPEGPSFVLDGHALRWLDWSLEVGFTPREGIVLHRVRHSGRSVLHRAALAEMWVPYGDPRAIHSLKNVFDEGEVGLGGAANPLRLGCDCLGHIEYLDAVVADEAGAAVVIPNAICIHEEDTGIAWKHTDDRSGATEVRRGRRLVVSSFATIGNYDYGFFWYLHTDGSIAYEVKLTGVVATGAVAPGAVPPHGSLVAEGVHGPNHLHVFSARLDVAIDGARNSVYELDALPDPVGADNPLGGAWRAHRTRLDDESLAQRPADPGTARTWLIANDDVRGAHGQPRAYQLVPGPALPALVPDGARALERARFATRSLWVTAYDPRERYAAGDYPYHAAVPDGVAEYAKAGRPLVDADVVVWHTFAAHHIVRPEDWPVMPVATTGFALRPFGFFDANPALDLPRPDAAEHCHHDHQH